MAEYIITCIITDDTARKADEAYKSITNVGTADRRFSTLEVVLRIENGGEFYVGTGSDRVKVEVVTKEVMDGMWENKYIRTHKDDKGENNLLNLPKCE
jgi:Protein of unknown function (DUF3892)